MNDLKQIFLEKQTQGNLAFRITSYKSSVETDSIIMFDGVEVVFDDMAIGKIDRMSLFKPAVIKALNLEEIQYEKGFNNRTEYKNAQVSAPGETIKDILEEKNWSVEKFAGKIGLTTQEAHKLLKGKMQIEDKLADKLGEVFGTDKEFWLKRDSNYISDLTRRKNEKDGQKLRKKTR
jgi:HTH-type transcriptional regulator/antitoxin HigA